MIRGAQSVPVRGSLGVCLRGLSRQTDCQLWIAHCGIRFVDQEPRNITISLALSHRFFCASGSSGWLEATSVSRSRAWIHADLAWAGRPWFFKTLASS